MTYFEKEKEEILKEILTKVSPSQLINYQQFLELYSPYKEIMSEKEFAYILEISSSSYGSMKFNNSGVRILKSLKKELSKETIELVINEILKKVNPGQSINYQQFLELYSPYKEIMSEKEFAYILEIEYCSYESMKYQKNVRILKRKIINLNKETIELVINEILKKVNPGQSINYQQFLELYFPYKEIMSEKEFAYILEIRDSSYNKMKTKNSKIRILRMRQRQLNKSVIEKIITELLTKVKHGESINYEEFLELYKPYKEKLNKREFAYILEISDTNFRNMKYKKLKVKILKSRKLSEEKKYIISQELLKKLKFEQSIDYEKFLELYSPYKEIMSEKEFAYILEISDTNFRNMKYGKLKVRILKSKKISEEEQIIIWQELLKKVNPGQSINYQQFLELYSSYKEIMSETEFVYILGIDPFYMKNQRKIIKGFQEKRKIIRVKYLTRQSRYYTKEELYIMANKLEISLEKLFKEIYNLSKIEESFFLIDKLNKDERIWKGNIVCSKNFMNKYSNYIYETAISKSYHYCCKYNCSSIKENIISNCVIFILENCGDIEINYSNNEELIKNILIRKISNNIKYQCLKFLKEKKKFIPLYKINSRDVEINLLDINLKFDSDEVENKVEEKMMEEELKNQKIEILEEKCMYLLNKYLSLGYSKEDALLEISKLININTDNILEILRKYMIQKQLVRKTNNGKYILN